MNPDALCDLARQGRLYPAVILYGGTGDRRREAVLELGRTLLCGGEPELRPCGACRHCRRIVWPDEEKFHPDFHVLERDLRTATSVEATRRFLQAAYTAPFEARGQVFVLAEAETLSGGAADALLKILEEPPTRTPRHFFLLAPARRDLLPTLRSRSLAVYLGSAEHLDEETVTAIGEALRPALDGYLETASPLHLLTAAEALARAPGWDDPRARQPWATAAAALVRYAGEIEPGSGFRRALLAVAEELLDGWRMRVRGITPGRILEGLLARHLTAVTEFRPRR